MTANEQKIQVSKDEEQQILVSLLTWPMSADSFFLLLLDERRKTERKRRKLSESRIILTIDSDGLASSPLV